MPQPNVVRKTANVAVTSTDDGTGNGTFKAVLSTPDLDRDNESVKTNEWKSLPSSIPINIDHNMSVSGLIGSAVPSFDNKGNLVINGTYASTPQAQEVRSLVNEGHLQTMSVEFLRFQTPTDQKGATKVERELIGGAYTPYPSNTNAKVLASKAGARNSAADQGNIQAIHDSAMALGATCVGEDDSQDNADADASTMKSVTVKDLGDEVEPLLQAVDASIDSALELLDGYDLTTLPPIVQQAIACLVAADASMDKVSVMIGLPDPDANTAMSVATNFGKSANAITAKTDADLPDALQQAYKAISTKPWSDFSQADYSLEQWKAACIVHPDPPTDVKGDYKLPIKEPNGDLNVNAVHAAAGRVHELQGASKSQAAQALLAAYKELKQDPPPALTELAGKSTDTATVNTAAIAADDTVAKDALTLLDLEVQAILLQLEVSQLD